ncbi:hypothetical protein C8Q76DRAFT_737604 [Earliella scabrosa]|nr:hypothetical protein C8Q76DRAFT_737604 [Earliella scabrosa]
MSTNTNPSRGSSIGAGLGSALKGAFETVQGIGNNIRGNAMDFVDSATGTSRQHPETQIGRAQAEEGVQRIEAGRHAAPDPAHTAAPSTTTTAPPPLPPRNEQGTLQSNGGAVGNDAMGGQIRSSI